jgi:hypothetical protein
MFCLMLFISYIICFFCFSIGKIVPACIIFHRYFFARFKELQRPNFSLIQGVGCAMGP